MRIHITGSTGAIGSYLTPRLAAQHDVIASARRPEALEAYRDLEQVSTPHLDVSDMEQCREVLRDVDVLIHLAVAPIHSSWEDTLEANLIGMYNVVESARANGIPRIIFTSSVHAVEGYPQDKQVEVTDLPHPPNLYGVSKVYGEALLSYYAHQHGVEAIVIRVAAFNGFAAEDGQVEVDPRLLAFYLHPDDLGSMIDHCLDLEMEEPYLLLHGISDNQFKRLSTYETVRRLPGYQPQYDAFEALGIELEKWIPVEEIPDDFPLTES